MNGEISALLPAIYTVLIIGGGYFVLWGKTRFINSVRWLPENEKIDFYKMNTYDKAIQSLISGTIVIVINSLVLSMPYETISNIEKLINSPNLIMFLFFQGYIIYTSAIAWSFFELFVIKPKEIRKKARQILIKQIKSDATIKSNIKFSKSKNKKK